MATAEQIKALVRSHFSDQTERFTTLALQIAAYEAKQGHAALAHDLRELVDSERKKSGNNIIPFPQDLKGLVYTEEPSTAINSLVIPDTLQEHLQQIIHEYFQQDKLKSFGMNNRRKILLIGPPGTGKTMTAKVFAHELKLPLNTIQVDRLVTKFMGETSAKLRTIFDFMQQQKAVYFFDEFDAIGSDRSMDNDVGEMRRVLNAFLQFIEQDNSDSIIVAATNNPQLLDQALFRRFDDVLYYSLPGSDERSSLIANMLGTFVGPDFRWNNIPEDSEGLSQAEISQVCNDVIKKAILSDKAKVEPASLLHAIAIRKGARKGRSKDSI